jgi:hypothetical protein
MQQDGEEETKGLAKRQLDVTQRKSECHVYAGREHGPGCSSSSSESGLTGVKECVRQRLSILDSGHGRQFQSHGYGQWHRP